MRRIANTLELQAELQRILAQASVETPSRAVLASELRSLADRVGKAPSLQDLAKPILDSLEETQREHDANETGLNKLNRAWGPFSRHALQR